MKNIENITSEKLITSLMAGLTAFNLSYAETEAFNRFLKNTFKPTLDAKLNYLQEENTRLRAYVDRKLTHHLPSYQMLEEKLKEVEEKNKLLEKEINTITKAFDLLNKNNKEWIEKLDKTNNPTKNTPVVNVMTHTYTTRSGKVLKCKILEKPTWFTFLVENENGVRVYLKRWDLKKIHNND